MQCLLFSPSLSVSLLHVVPVNPNPLLALQDLPEPVSCQPTEGNLLLARQSVARLPQAPQLSHVQQQEASSANDLPSSVLIQNAVKTALQRKTRMETDLVGAAELFPHLNEEEEEDDTASPLIDLFFNDSGAGVFKAITPFTRNEF